MNARELMTGNPQVVTAEDAIRHAARAMRERNVGMLPVVDDLAHMHVRGVITDRDIVVRCVAEPPHGPCLVADHMTLGHPASVPPEASAQEVIGVMKRHQIRRVLVVEAGRLLGVIAQADVALKEGPLEPLRVEAVLESISAPAS